MAFLIGLLAASFAPAWADESEAVKKGPTQLQGEWVMVSGYADGQPMPEPMLKQMKRVCKGDETTPTTGWMNTVGTVTCHLWLANNTTPLGVAG